MATLVGAYVALGVVNSVVFGYVFWNDRPPSAAADRAASASLVVLAALAAIAPLAVSVWRHTPAKAPRARLFHAHVRAAWALAIALPALALSALSTVHGLVCRRRGSDASPAAPVDVDPLRPNRRAKVLALTSIVSGITGFVIGRDGFVHTIRGAFVYILGAVVILWYVQALVIVQSDPHG